MALASLLVALLALVIAVATAIYTRRQASAAEGGLAIERDRRMEERRPRFSGKVKRKGTGEVELAVTLESNETLKWVELVIPPGQEFTFVDHQLGVFRPGLGEKHTRRAFSYRGYGHKDTGARKGMDPRETITWLLQLREDHVDTIRVDATCYGLAGERWKSVPIEVPVEPDMSKTVW